MITRSQFCSLVVLSVLLSGVLLAQDAPPDLEHALRTVRKHVERLENSVPNFICNQQILSQLSMDKKIKKETKARCVLTTIRTKRDRHKMFAETRADMFINGKRSKRNDISGPFVWHSGPAYSDLHLLFNSDYGLVCLEWRMVGPVKLGDKDALFVQTNASPEGLRRGGCGAMKEDSTDNIWLDAKTLNVMRIESRNPPATPVPGADLTLTVDYAPVIFDGEEYWLPSHFTSRLDFRESTQYLRYEASFTDYHKFGVDSVIHIDPVQ